MVKPILICWGRGDKCLTNISSFVFVACADSEGVEGPDPLRYVSWGPLWRFGGYERGSKGCFDLIIIFFLARFARQIYTLSKWFD